MSDGSMCGQCVLWIFVFLIPGTLSTCKDCLITSCGNVNYRVPLSFDCSQPNQVNLITDICPDKPVLPHYCAFFDVAGAMNDAINCSKDGQDYTTPWCSQFCNDTLSCIDEGFKNLARLTGNWQDCPQLTQNGTLPCVVVNQSVLDKYSSVKTVVNPLECRRYDSPKTPPLGLTWYIVELGGFDSYLTCPECEANNLTLRPLNNASDPIPIPLVFRPDKSFADLFPKKCSKYLSDMQIPTWGVWYIIWLIYSFLALVMLTVRRHYQPLASRSLFLVYYQCATIQIVLLGVYEIPVYQTTATCYLGPIFTLAFGVAMVMSPLILRAWRLYFLYRWNESKVDPQKSSWFFEHKYLLSPRSTLVALLVMHAEGLLVAFLAYGLAPTELKEETVFASGRCNWFQITPEIAQYASVNNINLGPTNNNPNGMSEWTVHYPSCQFCVIPFGLRALVIVNGSLYLAIVAGSLWMLRNLNDQYALWKELVQVMICAIITFPLCWLALNQTVFGYMEVYPGANLVWVIATFCLVWEFNASCVYPTLLTFRKENVLRMKELNSEEGSLKTESRSGTVVSNFSLKVVSVDGEEGLNATVNNILMDPFGVSAMQNFATEAFIAENVQYLLFMLNYSGLSRGEEKGKQAIHIYNEFIRVGSRLELNLPHSMRIGYDETFRNHLEKDEEQSSWTFFAPSTTTATQNPQNNSSKGGKSLDIEILPLAGKRDKENDDEEKEGGDVVLLDEVKQPRDDQKREGTGIGTLSPALSPGPNSLFDAGTDEKMDPEMSTPHGGDVEEKRDVPMLKISTNLLEGPPPTVTIDTTAAGTDGSLSSRGTGDPHPSPQASPQAQQQNQDLLKLSETTFDDVTKEVRNLVASNWLRFLASKHYSTLIKSVAQRNSSLWDNTNATIPYQPRKTVGVSQSGGGGGSRGGHLAPPSRRDHRRKSSVDKSQLESEINDGD